MESESSLPNLEYMNYYLDLDNKKASTEAKISGSIYKHNYSIGSIDSEKVLLVGDEEPWYFNYAINQRAYFKESGKGTYYNCGYDKNLVKASINKSNKVELESMIDKAKDTCKSLGFEEGTEKFADCGLKLYTQSVELAAKNK